MTVRAERPAPTGAGMAALLGLAAGAAALTLVHPVAMLADPGALPAPPGDWAMTLSGARAFVTDAWCWPVFAFEGLSSVHPTNAVFLDAIPLYALAWKALAHPAGVAFAWFLPVWLALLFLFQGAAGAVALRLAGVGARGPLIAGAFLMALMPVFLFRQIGHLALSAHGFVLLAVDALDARDRLARLDRDLEALLDRHPDGALIRSLPGMGAVLAAEFLACVGDVRRFGSADALASVAGLAPVLRQSGKTRGWRRARRGDKALKRVLCQSAFCAVTTGDPLSRAFHDRRRQEGKHHSQAIVALARRRVTVLWTLLRSRDAFDPDRKAA